MAAKSSMGDAAAAVADVEHMVKVQLEGPWEEGIVVAAARNTSVGFVVIAKVAVRTFCAGHVRKARPQTQENSTEEYGMISEGKAVATFVRLP